MLEWLQSLLFTQSRVYGCKALYPLFALNTCMTPPAPATPVHPVCLPPSQLLPASAWLPVSAKTCPACLFLPLLPHNPLQSVCPCLLLSALVCPICLCLPLSALSSLSSLSALSALSAPALSNLSTSFLLRVEGEKAVLQSYEVFILYLRNEKLISLKVCFKEAVWNFHLNWFLNFSKKSFKKRTQVCW
jgi:hypothetical protein